MHVASAKVPVRLALPRPVAHLLCNRQVLRVVLDGLRIVPLRLIRDSRYYIITIINPGGSLARRSRYRSASQAAAPPRRHLYHVLRPGSCLRSGALGLALAGGLAPLRLLWRDSQAWR